MDLVKAAQNIIGGIPNATVNAAQGLLSNLNPSNYKTPVLGQVRQLAANTFGKPDYSPQNIGLALGMHGASPELHPSVALAKFNNPAVQTATWDRFLTHEGTTPARVNFYLNKLIKGEPIEPLYTKGERNGLMGVEDGKNRLAAMKLWNIRDIPFIHLGK